MSEKWIGYASTSAKSLSKFQYPSAVWRTINLSIERADELEDFTGVVPAQQHKQLLMKKLYTKRGSPGIVLSKWRCGFCSEYRGSQRSWRVLFWWGRGRGRRGWRSSQSRNRRWCWKKLEYTIWSRTNHPIHTMIVTIIVIITQGSKRITHGYFLWFFATYHNGSPRLKHDGKEHTFSEIFMPMHGFILVIFVPSRRVIIFFCHLKVKNNNKHTNYVPIFSWRDGGDCFNLENNFEPNEGILRENGKGEALLKVEEKN